MLLGADVGLSTSAGVAAIDSSRSFRARSLIHARRRRRPPAPPREAAYTPPSPATGGEIRPGGPQAPSIQQTAGLRLQAVTMPPVSNQVPARSSAGARALPAAPCSPAKMGRGHVALPTRLDGQKSILQHPKIRDVLEKLVHSTR
jgi:hypothetical protein